MEKYIKVGDVEELLSRLLAEPAYQHEDEDFYVGVSTVSTELSTLPTTEFEPRKKAEWKLVNKGMFGADYTCSNCRTYAQESNSGHYDKLTSFCPVCGAVMLGGKK